MNTFSPFVALINRLEQHIARTEQRLNELKLQLEAARQMVAQETKDQPSLPLDHAKGKK